MSIQNLTDEMRRRAVNIKLLLMDCDGVLTDGKIYFSHDGEAFKAFSVHDGQGIATWHRAGFETGIITGRESQILVRRAEELGIKYLRQKSRNKTDDFNEILREANATAEEAAYIGDDLPDAPLLRLAGFPVLVRDAALTMEDDNVYITSKNGGAGAVREVVDLLIESKDRNRRK